VRVRGDSGLAELVPGFLENRRRDVEAIAAALAHADYENVRILGHNMKGSGAGYGLNRITEIGASLGQAAGGREAGGIRAGGAGLARDGGGVCEYHSGAPGGRPPREARAPSVSAATPRVWEGRRAGAHALYFTAGRAAAHLARSV